jgi:hypothetical protein
MSPIYVPGKVVLSHIQQYPAVLGEPWGGGYFAGYISHTADGNPTHALIVAPRETGATGTGYTLTTNLAWKTSVTATANTNSLFDGAANTTAMIADDIATGTTSHPAAQFCDSLTIAGFSDWYLPSRYELEIAYFNLKPSTADNLTTYGSNQYAIPLRSIGYTLSYPPRTSISTFASPGSQAFQNSAHWSSSEQTAARGWPLNFDSGDQIGNISLANKSTTYRVRAFRRIAL